MPVRELVAPAFSWVPSTSSGTAGQDAADLAESTGVVLLDEQRLALDVLLAERAGGQWASLEAAVIACRQNLKTFVLMWSALYDVFVRDVELVIWTAHRYRTAQSTFEDMVGVIRSTPHLSRRVPDDGIRYANGEQSIRLASGARVDFLARAGGAGGRGLTGDTVILDEALYLQPSMLAALLPTLSTRPDPHVRYGSSAGLPESEALRSIRDRGRALDDPTLCYVEWADVEAVVCESPDCDHRITRRGCCFDDETRWLAANPAMGARIPRDFIAAERRAMPPEEFARERLGHWDEPGAGVTRPFTLEQWQGALDAAATPRAPAVAVAVDPDLAFASVALAGRDGDRVVVEVVRHAPGVAWVPDVVARLRERLGTARAAVDLRGPAATPLPEWVRAGVDPFGPDPREYAAACGRVADLVRTGRLAHVGQAALDDAVTVATPKPYSDLWLWRRGCGALSVCALEAVTLAVWALTDAPRADPLTLVY